MKTKESFSTTRLETPQDHIVLLSTVQRNHNTLDKERKRKKKREKEKRNREKRQSDSKSELKFARESIMNIGGLQYSR